MHAGMQVFVFLVGNLSHYVAARSIDDARKIADIVSLPRTHQAVLPAKRVPPKGDPIIVQCASVEYSVKSNPKDKRLAESRGGINFVKTSV